MMINQSNRFNFSLSIWYETKKTAGYPYPKQYLKLIKSDFIQLNKATADIY